MHISKAETLLREADVLINAGGFRVRRGLTLDDYRRCHQQATAGFISCVRKGALFLQMSSAHVLGKSASRKLGNHAMPNPATYPSAAYAIAKSEADSFLKEKASENGFRLVYLRPTILWSRPGDTSLIDKLARLAQRGILLRLYPRDARHHFCHLSLLVEVARRVIERNDVPHLSALVVADPYTITNCELESLISEYVQHKTISLPVPALWMSNLLQHSIRSKNPKLDLRTWGDIFGVLHLDTVYDPSETFALLGIDQGQYSIDSTLRPFLAATFGKKLEDVGQTLMVQ